VIRLEEWVDIVAMHGQGFSINAIARHWGNSRQVVRETVVCRVRHAVGLRPRSAADSPTLAACELVPSADIELGFSTTPRSGSALRPFTGSER